MSLDQELELPINWDIDLEEEVDRTFPLETYRKHQRETIIDILEAYRSGVQSIILEAPTGSGKSVIAMTVAKVMKSAYYLTIQKILQSTLESDFGHWCAVLKGRNAYGCWHIRSRLGTDKTATADKGLCVRMQKKTLDICNNKCQYQRAMRHALSCPITIFNFSSFLYQKMAGRFTNPRNLLVIDEAHNIEPQVMNFVELKLKGGDFGFTMPHFNDPVEYKQYFTDLKVLPELRESVSFLKTQLNTLTANKSEEEISDDKQITLIIKELHIKERLLKKMTNFMQYIDNVECVAEIKDNELIIKPLRATYHAPRLLFSAAKHHLLMSATILNHEVLAPSIGLDVRQTQFMCVPHTFPVSNRLIHLNYAGSMKYNEKEKTIPILIDTIADIMNKHKDERGIIHCQSFNLMARIINGLPKNIVTRLTHQKQREFVNKDQLMEMHATKPASVLIAPAMHEGIDLKDDLSRFQIIAKVPYPSFKDDEQLKRRMKEDWSFYLWLTSCKLCQSYGRSCRSPNDYCSTYICDEDFTKFLGHCTRYQMIPDWIIQAIRVNGEPL